MSGRKKLPRMLALSKRNFCQHFFSTLGHSKTRKISSSLFGQFVNSLTQALLLGLKGSKDGWETRKLTPIGEKNLLSSESSPLFLTRLQFRNTNATRNSDFFVISVASQVIQSPCSMGEGGGETTSHYFSATF